MTTTGFLALADGTILNGAALGTAGTSVGEVVFNTAMTGYQEILTDPSYHQQLVCLTGAHVGCVGINAEDNEAPRPQVAGLIVRDLPRRMSNWRATEPLDRWLVRHGVVAIGDLDTRHLTHLLRRNGSQSGCLVAGQAVSEDEAIARARAFPGLDGADLASVVTGATATEHGAADAALHVAALDYGIKQHIIDMLTARGCRVTLLPSSATAEDVRALAPDGVFLSNGPGDPAAVPGAQQTIRTLVEAGLPTFGICLGHQLLCLALGARSLKMPFGHHGANHPVRDHDTGQVAISSQNHGFAIDAESLPAALRISHTSLFDGSLQGVRHTARPAFGFQGHPEASPGPHDLAPLFDRFIDSMRPSGTGKE